MQVEQLIRQTAELDGRAVRIFMEQEPGSSGINTIDHYCRRVLSGYAFYGIRPTGSKEERARPVSCLNPLLIRSSLQTASPANPLAVRVPGALCANWVSLGLILPHFGSRFMGSPTAPHTKSPAKALVFKVDGLGANLPGFLDSSEVSEPHLPSFRREFLAQNPLISPPPFPRNEQSPGPPDTPPIRLESSPLVLSNTILRTRQTSSNAPLHYYFTQPERGVFTYMKYFGQQKQRQERTDLSFVDRLAYQPAQLHPTFLSLRVAFPVEPLSAIAAEADVRGSTQYLSEVKIETPTTMVPSQVIEPPEQSPDQHLESGLLDQTAFAHQATGG